MKTANETAIQNCELVTVKVANASATRFPFPISENLRGKKITAIEVYKLADVSKSPMNEANLNDTARLKGFVTLQTAGKEKVKDMPLNTLIASNNNGLVKEFDGIVIDFQKSYITFSETSGLVANEVVMLNFYFQD